VEWAEFVEDCAPLVRQLSGFGRSDPLSDGVSRQPGTLGYLMQRELVAEVHPPDFSQHFHADQPRFSCSKSEQKQLNTWGSFQSAEQPLLGHFSVSGNTPSACFRSSGVLPLIHAIFAGQVSKQLAPIIQDEI
jgi:hypothetical protein